LSENSSGKDARKSVFVRQATGLVKEAGLFDIFQFNAVSATGVAIISGSALLLPLMTYGNGIWEAITIGFALSLFVNVVYYVLSTTIPRSGGDYVYISRLLHPSLGVLSAGLTGIFGTLVLAATFGASVWVTSGLVPLLSAVGQANLASSLSSTTSLTIAGILTTLFFGVLLVFGGNRVYYRLNNLLYAVAVLGILAATVSFLVVGHVQFLNLFNNYASTYNTSATDIINTANSLGYTQPSSGIWSVLVASALLFTSFYWMTQSSYLGGEIRNSKKNQFWGMIGAAFFWYVLTLVSVYGLYVVVGPDLISHASFLSYFHPSSWKIPVVSFFALYGNIAANNVIVQILVSLAFIFGYITVTAWSYMIFSRAVFALSFDRLFPTSLSDINDRFHTPVKAFIVFGILTVIFLALLTFPSTAVTIYTYGVGLNVVYMISFILASISLVALPYRYRSLFDSSSPIKSRIGGVPAVSIIGAISIVLLLFYEYVFITNSTYFGVTNNFLEVMAGFIVFFLVLYFVIKEIRKRQGVQVELAYREIPPE